MKWLLFVNLIFSLNCLEGQNLDSNEIFEFVTPLEIMPKWIHGTNDELIQEITSKIIYPSEECIEGTTVLQFKVDTLGQVKEPKIMRSISKDVDEQLLRIICNYEFESGIFVNKKVDYLLNLPIRIKLE